MSDSVIDDIVAQNDGQKIKTSEITGERFQFHSLPKEFQDWHNNYYILEKQGEIDSNAVSKAMLNSYMWLAVFDGTKYALFLFSFVVFAIIKWKLGESFLSFFLGFLTLLPILIFVAYHFIFYAMIQAQVIGPVTKTMANSTSHTFMVTFFAVFFSLISAFIFFVYFLKSFLVILFYFIADLYSKHGMELDSFWQKIIDYLIIFHNLLVRIIEGNSIFNNIYTYTLIIAFIVIFFLLSFYQYHFILHRSAILKEMKKEKLRQGYPIEVAQQIIKEWRKRHGM